MFQTSEGVRNKVAIYMAMFSFRVRNFV